MGSLGPPNNPLVFGESRSRHCFNESVASWRRTQSVQSPCLLRKSGAKVQLNFDLAKYFYRDCHKARDIFCVRTPNRPFRCHIGDTPVAMHRSSSAAHHACVPERNSHTRPHGRCWFSCIWGCPIPETCGTPTRYSTRYGSPRIPNTYTGCNVSKFTPPLLIHDSADMRTRLLRLP